MEDAEAHLLWLAEQCSMHIVEGGSNEKFARKLTSKIEALRDSSNAHVAFAAFVEGVDLSLRLSRAICGRARTCFTDVVNRANFDRFLFDYMSNRPTLIPALDDFFGTRRFARIFRFVTLDEEHSVVAYAAAIEPDGTPERRLVLYALALSVATSAVQWRRLERLRAKRTLDAVWADVDAQEIRGVALSTARKHVYDAVFSSSSCSVSPAVTDSACEAREKVEEPSIEALLTSLAPPPVARPLAKRVSRKAKLKDRRRRAASTIQRAIAAWWGERRRVRSNSFVRWRRAARERARARPRAAVAIARAVVAWWDGARRLRSNSFARWRTAVVRCRWNRIRARNVIAARLRAWRGRRTSASVLDYLLAELVDELVRPIHGHRALALAQKKVSCVHRVGLAFGGTTYQFVVSETSPLFARRDDPTLVDDIVAGRIAL